jgi:hypothetical protein
LVQLTTSFIIHGDGAWGSATKKIEIKNKIIKIPEKIKIVNFKKK